VELEKRGKPTALVLTDEFAPLGRAEAEALAMPGLPFVAIPHPMDRLGKEEVREAAERALKEIVYVLTQPPQRLSAEYKEKYQAPRGIFRRKGTFAQETGETSGSIAAANHLYYERGWTDGLPIIPPTERELQKMLRYTDWDPEEVLAALLPRRGKATLRKIAINSIMAGCLPEYFPVVVAAVQAMSQSQFNLPGIIATTNPASPLVIVNGPVINELDFNCGYGVFGSGWRANATVGRAVRLVVLNIAGGIPGVLDRATFGQTGKYSFCIAENEELNPWGPLHLERGFAKETSTVTLFGGAGPHNIVDMTSTTALGLLSTIAGGMSASGANNITGGGEPLLVLGPEFARKIAGEGFSKMDVKKFLYENARAPLTSVEGLQKYRARRKSFLDETRNPLSQFTIADKPEDVIVIVAGGGGPHAQYVGSFFNNTRSVTLPIARKDGSPVSSMKDFLSKKG